MKNFKYTINGTVYEVAIDSIDDTNAKVEVNGDLYEVKIEKSEKENSKSIKSVEKSSSGESTSNSEQNSYFSILKSPLPGIILDITCSVGDTVKRGQRILVLEAMKMENAINSDRDGVIKEIKVSKSETVLEGADLVVIG